MIAEQRDVPDVRLGDRLEALRRERTGVLCLQRQALRTAPLLRVDRRPLGRRGTQLDDLRQQRAGAIGELGGTAEEREELAARHAGLHGGDRFAATDLFTAEVTLEPRVVGRGGALDQLLPGLLETLLVL